MRLPKDGDSGDVAVEQVCCGTNWKNLFFFNGFDIK